MIYEDDIFHTRSPIYGTELNQFIHYYFPDTAKIACPKNFFVGWRQLDQQRLNLGLDRNFDHADKIKFSVDGGGSWMTSPFPGSAMMRPIFSTALDPILGLSKPNQIQTFTCYPNPAMDEIQFQSEANLLGAEKFIFDASGRLITSSKESVISLIGLQSGMYFISIPSISPQPVKIIKQ